MKLWSTYHSFLSKPERYIYSEQMTFSSKIKLQYLSNMNILPTRFFNSQIKFWLMPPFKGNQLLSIYEGLQVLAILHNYVKYVCFSSLLYKVKAKVLFCTVLFGLFSGRMSQKAFNKLTLCNFLMEYFHFAVLKRQLQVCSTNSLFWFTCLELLLTIKYF